MHQIFCPRRVNAKEISIRQKDDEFMFPFAEPTVRNFSRELHGEPGESSVEREASRRHLWSGTRLTKIQTTTRPDHVWQEVWTKIGKSFQNREKQEWTKEMPKLDSARRLRGIEE